MSLLIPSLAPSLFLMRKCVRLGRVSLNGKPRKLAQSGNFSLLTMHNDILLNMAKGSVTALTLLDLSTAFNTIDHTILLDRLNVYYGISELALGWFKSYLSGRTHLVKVGSTLSYPATLQYGVPQGSLLGPIRFSSTLTQLAQLFTLTLVLTTISTPMTLSYTYCFHQQISLVL